MLACGFDEGCVVVELGSDDPVASMDSTGKIVWANNNDIQTANVRGLTSGAACEDDLPDGERLSIVPRDL
jgi:coatomer subunit beta'